MIVISDNSVLSCLAEIGELDLLRRLYGEIIVTDTIRREAMHSGAPESLRELFLKTPDWIKLIPDHRRILRKREPWMPGRHRPSRLHGDTGTPAC